MSGRSLSRFDYSKAKRNKSHHTNKGAAGSNLIKAEASAAGVSMPRWCFSETEVAHSRHVNR